VPEEASPEADQWCKAAQKADIHSLASLIERGVLADQELDTVRIGVLWTGCPIKCHSESFVSLQLGHTALMMAAQEGW
jgi:hypothetical protein